MAAAIKKHFVTFYSPGTFVAETTTKPIRSWNVATALKMARSIKERYGAKPYGFRFTTRARGKKDLDSKVSAESPMHYFNCKVETLEEIKARANPNERILIANMEGNGWSRVVSSKSGWRFTQPLEANDVVL